MPTQSCLLLYSLCANIGHSHTVAHCLIHFNTQSTFTFDLSLSIFDFIAFVLMACSCPAIISDSVSIFILPSLSHCHFSSPATSSIWLKSYPCNFSCFKIFLHSFLLLSLNSFTISIIPRCCS